MENALLVGLSRQNALQRELDIVANNIANMNTTGYKADGAVFAEFLNTRARGDQFATSDRRVSFVQDRMTWHDMTPGSTQQTGNPLDIAIDGNAFLVVQTPRGERYTRNGALQVNAAGELVTSAGDKVLGDAGPIVMQNTDRGLVINPDGSVRVQASQLATSDQGRGKIRLVTFANPQQLRKDGNSTFAAPNGVTPQAATNARLVQGAIEHSNVRPVVEMTRMIELTRAYSDISGIIQQQADLRRTSIERLADVPA
jgi:flagellar basal-body rod protein FlgF